MGVLSFSKCLLGLADQSRPTQNPLQSCGIAQSIGQFVRDARPAHLSRRAGAARFATGFLAGIGLACVTAFAPDATSDVPKAGEDPAASDVPYRCATTTRSAKFTAPS